LKHVILVLGLAGVIFAGVGFTVYPLMKQQFAAPPPAPLVLAPEPILKGDPEAGERLFFDGGFGCPQCHRVRGRGGEAGPDLTEVSLRRSNENLRRAILIPNTGRPTSGFLTATVVDLEGRVHTGITRSVEEDPLRLVLDNGEVMSIAQDDIDEVSAQPLTSMPTNYADVLTVRQLADIVAFLEQGPTRRRPVAADRQTGPAAPATDTARKRNAATKVSD
jgi:putative heme-binding domain-containing protein